MAIAQRELEAFMEDPDAPNPGNPIHSTDGARSRGFRAALVGGTTVYGWATPVIVEALGSRWLHDGWADVQFRQPVYPGDVLSIVVADGALTISKRDGDAAVVAIRGTVGVGPAPWLPTLVVARAMQARPRAQEVPQLTPANAPVGADLIARSVHLSVAEALTFARLRQAETVSELVDELALLAHPAWLAAQPIHLLHHAFNYGPAIHTASRVQHLAPARAGQTFVVGGHCVEAFARNGHQYIVNDATIVAADGIAVAQLRHTAIYQVAARS